MGESVILGPDNLVSGYGECSNSPECQDQPGLGPIPVDVYEMFQHPDPKHVGFWNLVPLERDRLTFGLQCRLGFLRCGFQLHPGSYSAGCITYQGGIDSYYSKIIDVLNDKSRDILVVVP